MHTETINHHFEKILNKRGVHQVVGKTSNAVRQLRYRKKQGENITLTTQLHFLQKSGVRLEQFQWTDKDMIALLKFYANTSEMARQFGPEYVLEKFKGNRNQL